MFNDDNLTAEQRKALREADDHADRVYLDGPDKVMEVKPMTELQKVWENHSIPEVIEALLNWGWGTGEELYDFLVNEAHIAPEEAKRCMQILNAAMENY